MIKSAISRAIKLFESIDGAVIGRAMMAGAAIRESKAKAKEARMLQ